MKKKLLALLKFILSGCALVILYPIYLVIQYYGRIIMISLLFIGFVFVIRAYPTFKATGNIKPFVPGGILLLFGLLTKPILILIIKAIRKLMWVSGVAQYELTGKAPKGWTVQVQSQPQPQPQQNVQQQSELINDRPLTQEEIDLETQKENLRQAYYKFYQEKKQFEEEKMGAASMKTNAGAAQDFFAGCKDQEAIKKRYRELLKIYHPDNQNGDTSTVEEINRQYEKKCGK